jgi:UDP-arabinose 4-epimerase
MAVRKPTIVVTGGAGYIGAHTCKTLSRSGFQPVVVDNLVRGHRNFIRWGPFEPGDILDIARIDKILKKHRPVAIVHFAGFAYVGESVANPERYYHNNVVGSLNLLEAMRRNAVDKMVFSSSCTTYGQPDHLPIDENHPQRPENPYGNSKLAVEKILIDYHRAHGINSVILRYFNAAGADPEGEIGEDHRPETHLIPLALKAIETNSAITVNGDDYRTPDGTCIRDYIHVDDLARAHVQALRLLSSSATSDCFNLGNGCGHSVLEVIETAERVTGKRLNVAIGPRRPGDPDVLVGAAERARRKLNWIPKYPDLEAIVETAWNWQRHNSDRFVHSTALHSGIRFKGRVDRSR